MSLRTELLEYVNLLQRVDSSGEGIDGDAVPRELCDILARTSVHPSELILSLVDVIHTSAMDKLGDHEAAGWSNSRRSSWADGVIFANQELRDAARGDA
jgi:hypothetical protein